MADWSEESPGSATWSEDDPAFDVEYPWYAIPVYGAPYYGQTVGYGRKDGELPGMWITDAPGVTRWTEDEAGG